MAQIAELTADAPAPIDEGIWTRLVRTVSADDFGPDFSGVHANARLELHMRDCERNRQEDRQRSAEQQGEIRAAMTALHGRLDAMLTSFDKRLSEIRQSFDDRMKEQAESTDKRLNAMGNRMWAAAIGLIMVLLAVLGPLAVHFITTAAKGP
jgi:hypothetical protein